jgi:hypothetical protein
MNAFFKPAHEAGEVIAQVEKVIQVRRKAAGREQQRITYTGRGAENPL